MSVKTILGKLFLLATDYTNNTDTNFEITSQNLLPRMSRIDTNEKPNC